MEEDERATSYEWSNSVGRRSERIVVSRTGVETAFA